jgi:mono/diheme cytochrome c family protein
MHILRPNSFARLLSLVSGHNFSRANDAKSMEWALAPGGSLSCVAASQQGLKPRSFARRFAARLKSCPVTKLHLFRREAAPRPILSRTLRKGGRATLFAGIAGLLLLAGCRQDMQDQPKMQPQRGSDFFADHRGARPQVLDTVARGQLHEDSYFYTGVVQGPNGYKQELDQMPSEIPVTMEVLERGQERFNVYCTPCHSRVGNGLGEIVQRGFKPAGNLHDQVRMSQPLSHYFYVMTHGYGAMPDYSTQLPPADRWAVAAYIRALQLSQAATVKDVPTGTQIRNLKDLATEENHPEYAQPWPLPATAVQAYKPIGSEGTPGMAPAYPADPKITIPKTAPPAAAK